MSINIKDPSYKVLEVCADSAESAVTAEKAGALRIELCANLIIGGTTPTIGLVEEVKKAVSLPVNVLIRPRFGDFCYTRAELNAMKRDIALCRDAGADGIVIGCLKADGSLDTEAMAGLIASVPAGGLFLTLHRAFDMCKDPVAAYRSAAELGFDTILTSGQSASCYEGRSLLAQLNAQRTQGEPLIMAGGGLKPELIVPLAREATVRSFHLSGKKIAHSPMQWKNPKVSMSAAGFSEYEIWTADETVIRSARAQFDTI